MIDVVVKNNHKYNRLKRIKTVDPQQKKVFSFNTKINKHSKLKH